MILCCSKGVESAVATAEKMIMDIVNGASNDKKDWQAPEERGPE